MPWLFRCLYRQSKMGQFPLETFFFSNALRASEAGEIGDNIAVGMNRGADNF